jgi:ATP-dependent RNA helicase DDX52/ROK1
MKARVPIFPSPILSFKDLSSASISHQLANNIAEQGFDVPTEVQLGALPLLMNDSAVYLNETRPVDNGIGQHTDGIDLLTVAPTGSGKTLAFLIPLMHSLRLDKRSETTNERHTSAIILAPTRELASQIVNEGRKLAKNSGMRITQMRKGMRFGVAEQSPKPEGGFGSGTRHNDSIVKADILVATPGVLQTMLHESKDLQPLRHVRYLILDEADVLLDPLFREQTLEIWNSLTHHDLRVSMWSATMGSNIEELAVATIRGRRERLREETGSDVDEAPLIRLIVGLKDSAVPNVQHKLIYAATEQGKLMGLRQLLHPTTSSIDAGPPLRPPFLVFTQTIERAIALHAELLYDIPAEAGGIDRIAVLHSDLSDTARDRVMTRFRNGEVWVLITTDLLSRGVDFLGVNGVVNYDIPTSSAAYVHRIGRTGRAGRSGGVAVTLYSKEDLPYLKHIANVVAMARRQKGDKLNMDRWLLDSLPSLSRNEKQKLRKRGVESRTTRGKEKDPEAARKTQISSKSGYDRRMENRRKAAIVGSKRDAQIESDAGAETDFGGFE